MAYVYIAVFSVLSASREAQDQKRAVAEAQHGKSQLLNNASNFSKQREAHSFMRVRA